MKFRTLSGATLAVLFFSVLLPSAQAFTLTVIASGPGSVAKNPTNANYPNGVVVTITATPDAGASFTGWSADTNSLVNPLNITMSGNYVITGNFTAFPTYSLALTTNGQGSIVLNPAGPNYSSNTTVSATATPSGGWVFTGWTGNAGSGTNNPLTFPMNANKSLTGNFAQLPVIDVQPVGVTNAPGSIVNLSAHAIGTAPLAYQWLFNGATVAGATNATLNFASVQFSSTGFYQWKVTNNYGSATSYVALLVLTNGFANSVSVCDEPSLRAAIAGGGWIQFGCNGTVTLSNTVTISNAVILDGSLVSATISGGNAVRLFTVAAGGSLTASNLTFANGLVRSNNLPADGGAIYNDSGNILMVSCTLTNNHATNTLFDLGGSQSMARGGAIFNSGGTVTVQKTFVANNNAVATSESAYGQGGAIYTTNGTATFSDCVFSNNSCISALAQPAAAGGAAYLASGNILFSNCLFTGNSAAGAQIGLTYIYLQYIPGLGGAIAAMAGNLTVNQCQFLNNVARGGSETGYGGVSCGGAVYCAATAAISGSQFFNNRLPGMSSKVSQTNQGGAIFNSGVMVLNGCCFCSNFVRGTDGVFAQIGLIQPGGGHGGGLFNAGVLTATNCTFALNSAQGGAAYSQFSFGPATGPNAASLGAGLYNDTSGVVVLMNVTMASNLCSSATSLTNGFSAGDQIANVSGTLRIRNSLLAYAGTNGNVYGPVVDNGYNFSSDGSAAFSGGTSFNFTDPKLLAPTDNGGLTLTMALAGNSPAIDYGDSTGAPVTDQRGYNRPVDAGVDVGAYEFGAFGPLLPMNLSVVGVAPSLSLNFTASPPATYHLQSSTDLTTWNDEEVISGLITYSNVMRSINPQTSAKKFFRVWYQ